VDHPYLVAVLDAGLTPARNPFYVRDYLPSSDLFSEHAKAATTLLAAVSFLGSKGRVHGRIKPSNIFFSSGLVKIADPRIEDIRSSDFSEEEIQFTAPEVLNGGRTTFESDLYSVGAILYRLFTGRDPFEDPELNHLKSKYIWATPRPIADLCHVSKTISDLVSHMLEKDPRKREPAFAALKDLLGVDVVLANRPAFIGREHRLQEICSEFESVRKSTLRVILIDGGPGIGKSRLIEEIQIRCAFQSVAFAIGRCSASSRIDFLPIVQPLRALIKHQNMSDTWNDHIELGDFWPTLSKYFFPEQDKPSHDYPLERTVSDFVGLTGSLARRIPTLIVIEDIQYADTALQQFLEKLCMRAAETPLLLILTGRPNQHLSKLSNTLHDYLADSFRRFHLDPLTATQSEDLVQYLDASPDRQRGVLQMSAGNPLFIEEYAQSDILSALKLPEHLQDAVEWILSIPTPLRHVAEILSLFEQPIDFYILAKLCENTLDEAHEQVRALTGVEVAECTQSTASVRYPAVRARLYSNMTRQRRAHLHRMVYTILLTKGSDQATLAHHSFRGGLLDKAAILCTRLARESYEQKNYSAAIYYYETNAKCANFGKSSIVPADKLKLAICYSYAGKQALARRLLRHLISSEALHGDSELLSSAYVSLANDLPKNAVTNRIQMYRLAIDCLSPDSPQMMHRYSSLSRALIQIGDLPGAAEALHRAEEHFLGKDLDWLKYSRALYLINTGDFRAGAECLTSFAPRDANRAIVLTNLAFCMDNLGEVRKARELSLLALKVAEQNGFVPIQILLLSNRASIETKLGNLRGAAELFTKALDWIDRLRDRGRQFETRRFGAVYGDAALHYVHTGKYRRAADCINKIGSGQSVFAIDRLLIGLARCEFYLKVGQYDKIQPILDVLNNSEVFKTEFFQVEQALVKARLEESASHAETLFSLEQSLVMSEKVGTLYQHCKVLNELAAFLVSANQKSRAEECAKKALRMAKAYGYKVLGTRALFLCGLAAEVQRKKELCLLGALQTAVELCLPELVAESAFHIGLLQLAKENYVTAHEYLVRSISTTTALAEEIPIGARAGYLAISWRRDARRSLERCNNMVQTFSDEYSSSHHARNEDRYFRAVYRLTIAATTAHALEPFVTALLRALETALLRPAVIMLTLGDTVMRRSIRIRLSSDVIERIDSLNRKAQNRIYFGCPEKSQGKETVAWIPLRSQKCAGGIYVACRSGELPLREKEMEFLTILGTVSNRGLEQIQSRAELTETVDATEFHGIIGASKPIREVYSHIEIAAGNAATVLIEGESGTGKELVAKAIHAASQRAKEEFVAVDCGAIPETLIEAELFGAKKGSYTGATVDRPGLFEAAHRGTIFLDEISNTSPAVQAKLLRVLQEREVRRIGETKGRPVDVRLIVASNANLDALVQDERFRKDLLYRLKVLHIKLPPLRNRREDIPMLAHAFLDRLNLTNKTRKHFAPGVVNHLLTHSFPGNVRELQNAIERAFFSARGTIIEEIPLEHRTEEVSTNEVQTWFKDLADGRKDFWSAVHNRYKRRDISREKVIALVDFGLRSTRGSYKMMASMFRLKENEYRRFMDFLRRNDCLLDFRPYRKAADNAS